MRVQRSDIYNQGPSASCSSKTIFRELSSGAKEAILEKHNQLRRGVRASNMKKLVRTGHC